MRRECGKLTGSKPDACTHPEDTLHLGKNRRAARVGMGSTGRRADMGKIFKFASDVDTDQIIASQYLLYPTIEEMAPHAFESLDETFARSRSRNFPPPQ